MSLRSPGADPAAAPERSRSPVRLFVLIGAVGAVLVVVLGALFVRDLTRQDPTFPSLAAAPDPSLRGTVAYFADRSACVRVVAAAGTPAKDVLCLPGQDVAKAEKLGKEVGPQLVWRPDGRLEVTMFRMTDPPGPSFNPGWQKVVDVRTGAVEDVAAADVPSAPDLGTHTKVSPSGQQVQSMSSDRGHVEVVVTDSSGARTVMAADGNRDYRLIDAFWAPNGEWIAADDGRILLITPGAPSLTRVLTDESTQIAFSGEDPRLARFAVTSADLLTPSS